MLVVAVTGVEVVVMVEMMTVVVAEVAARGLLGVVVAAIMIGQQHEHSHRASS